MREEQGVSRMYGEPAVVWVRDGQPARFVWRGRLYTVREVLDHWVVSSAWWLQRVPDPPALAGRECWRVEAATGPGIPAATYELRHDPATGGWLLARVWD
jgi:hypothetical protein